MTVISSFAEFAADYRRAVPTPEVLHHAKRAVIDWYAALVPGSIHPPATLLEQAFPEGMGHGSAQLADGRACVPTLAALINGAAAHTEEVDDIFRDAMFHPGAPTIAAALAAAQDVDASGLDFLRAVIAGYEVSTRIGVTMGRAHYRYWHSTATIGTFGAAAAAGVLYGLDTPRMGHALAMAATMAAGLQQAYKVDSMSKPLHAGRAAEAGVVAARAARAGITGASNILEAEHGFGRALSDGPDWGPALATLGRVHHITAMTFKNHACCGHAFAPIDGALALRDQMGIERVDDMERVEVATYAPALQLAGNPTPKTASEARFSIPYVVACALIHGSVRLAAFTPERMAEPGIRALMQRIVLSVDPELDARFPNARSARLTIKTTDGRRESLLQPTRKGDPDMPLTDQDLAEKFLELTAPVLGMQQANHSLEALWKLESAKHVDLGRTGA